MLEGKHERKVVAVGYTRSEIRVAFCAFNSTCYIQLKPAWVMLLVLCYIIREALLISILIAIASICKKAVKD